MEILINKRLIQSIKHTNLSSQLISLLGDGDQDLDCDVVVPTTREPCRVGGIFRIKDTVGPGSGSCPQQEKSSLGTLIAFGGLCWDFPSDPTDGKIPFTRDERGIVTKIIRTFCFWDRDNNAESIFPHIQSWGDHNGRRVHGTLIEFPYDGDKFGFVERLIKFLIDSISEIDNEFSSLLTKEMILNDCRHIFIVEK